MPFLTPEEEMRQREAARILAGQVAGQVPQMSPVRGNNDATDPTLRSMANQKFDSRERVLANQLRRGQENLYSQGPQGKQAGRVYVAPTWSENLNSAAQKMLGGLDVRRARQGMEDIEGRRGQAAEATGLIQAAQAEEAARQQAATEQDRTTGRDLQQQGVDLQGQSLAQSVAEANAEAERSRAQDAEKAGARNIETFHTPDGGVINLKQDAKGNFYDLDDNPMPREYVETLTPYSSGAQSSKALQAAAQAEEDIDTTELEIDAAGRVITDPLLRTATGPWFDPEKQLSKHGVPGYEDEQATFTKASSVGIKAAGPTLAELGVNPTDTDLEVALEGAPGPSKGPETWLSWYENDYMPAMSKELKRQSPEKHDDQMKKMADTLAKGKKIQEKGKTVDREEDSGFTIRKIR